MKHRGSVFLAAGDEARRRNVAFACVTCALDGLPAADSHDERSSPALSQSSQEFGTPFHDLLRVQFFQAVCRRFEPGLPLPKIVESTGLSVTFVRWPFVFLVRCGHFVAIDSNQWHGGFDSSRVQDHHWPVHSFPLLSLAERGETAQQGSRYGDAVSCALGAVQRVRNLLRVGRWPSRPAVGCAGVTCALTGNGRPCVVRRVRTGSFSNGSTGDAWAHVGRRGGPGQSVGVSRGEQGCSGRQRRAHQRVWTTIATAAMRLPASGCRA